MCYPCPWTGVTYLCGLYTCAGMTAERAGMTAKGAGMTAKGARMTAKRATLMTERASRYSFQHD